MNVRRHPAAVLAMAALLAALALPATAAEDARLKGSARGARNGWITVRLQGTPADVGYQHGALLAPEIADAVAVAKLNSTHDGKRDWAFFRKAAETVFWPRVDAEYRQEMQGIAEGAAAAGAKVDLWDVVALNASIEFGYYTAALDQDGRSGAPDKCSAFVATGRYTRDGMPVVAHNNWSGYLEGSRWNVVFDIRPAAGHRFLMDGMPGLIHSGDDFGVNSAGLVITETTITGFQGFDPKGVPEFARARKAMQYAAIDRRLRPDHARGQQRRLRERVARGRHEHRRDRPARAGPQERDARAHEGRLLRGHELPRQREAGRRGDEVQARRPVPERERPAGARGGAAERERGQHRRRVRKGATSPTTTTRTRRRRTPRASAASAATSISHRAGWATGSRPSARRERSRRRSRTRRLAKRMAFEAAMGHPCGTSYLAAPHLAKHPDYAWTKPLMRDLVASPWTRFEAR